MCSSAADIACILCSHMHACTHPSYLLAQCSCLATKVFIGNLPITGRGEASWSWPMMNRGHLPTNQLHTCNINLGALDHTSHAPQLMSYMTTIYAHVYTCTRTDSHTPVDTRVDTCTLTISDRQIPHTHSHTHTHTRGCFVCTHIHVLYWPNLLMHTHTHTHTLPMWSRSHSVKPDAGTLHHLASFYHNTGRISDAKSTFVEALKLEPHRTETVCALVSWKNFFKFLCTILKFSWLKAQLWQYCINALLLQPVQWMHVTVNNNAPIDQPRTLICTKMLSVK